MTEIPFEQQFRRGDATADELQAAIEEIIGQLSDPTTDASEAAGRAGLDRAAVTASDVEVSERQQGAEPVLTTIAVTLAVKAGSTVASSLWTEVIWPRLRRRLGARALGPAVTQGDDAR